MAPKNRRRIGANTKHDFGQDMDKRHYKSKGNGSDAANDDMGLIYPGGDMAFKFLLLARFCSTIWSHITDCDETFNFWEPSHFLLYRSGHQTWEYSPQYALRSYTYLLVHMVPAKLYTYLLDPNPIHIFYFVRCLLAIGCVLSEVYFYKNICHEFGIHIARLTLAFLITSSGMFISSTAFLPSSFSMCLNTVAIAAWYKRKYELAIFAIALSSLLGWPFAALLGLPIAIEMLFHKREWLKFFKWAIISAAVILTPMIWIDSLYYGKLVIAPLNILLYNVFTNHGPNLYGTEPISFYFINGFLNFNFIFIGALFTPLFLLIGWILVPAKPRPQSCLPYWYSLAPLYLWFLVFFFQPHKEERFLFPVYPLICLHGAITFDVAQKLYFFIKTNFFNYVPRLNHYLANTSYLTIFAIIVCGLCGISRSLALHQGYYAPMQVMTEANKLEIEGNISKGVNINFCIGKEWHRFPSSFFFPSKNWKLQYLKSEFRGQLPQAYLDENNATSIERSNFNDLNKEEPDRYFDIEKCHFILDLDLGKSTIYEPNYSRQSDRFTVIKSSEFLDARNSHPFFRAFYIPFLSHKYCSYGTYNLLQNSKLKLPIYKQKSKGSSSKEL